MAQDYYQALGVTRAATADQIQQAFRKLARQHHPDVNTDPAAEERFKEINEAYSVLSDPDQRKRYDRFGQDFRRIPEDYDERAGAGFGGFGEGLGQRGTRVHFGQGFPGAGFEDLFGDLFGGAGTVQGADQEAELPLTIEEAYRGGKRTVTLSGPSRTRDYTVNIPPGVVDGQRIRLAGQGGQGGRGGPAGDLYLVVRIRPHARFRLSDRDIHVGLPVTPGEAALGATVPVQTPAGEAKVRVPAGSSTGRRLRLRGEGMPNPRGKPGDLYAEVRVMVPATVSNRERELYEQLAAVSTFDPRASS
jgi:curved DNA-binding protein